MIGSFRNYLNRIGGGGRDDEEAFAKTLDREPNDGPTGHVG